MRSALPVLAAALAACAAPPAPGAPQEQPAVAIDSGVDTGGCTPGSVDAPYDGFDADCDGMDDFDADRDGFRAQAFGGSDCDDSDPSVYLDAPVVCGDGIDNDCDGEPECGMHDIVVVEDLAVARFDGTDASGAGREVHPGDVDGDGLTDLLMVGMSDSWLFRGSLLDSRPAAAADGMFTGTYGALGDLDGDGLDDITTVTSTFNGPLVRVWAATAYTGAPVAESNFVGEGIPFLGFTVGDASGDGLADVLLATADEFLDMPLAGGALVSIWNGPLSGMFDSGDIDAVLLVGDVGSVVGDMEATTDLTGDGVVDVVVASSLGVVYLAEGPVSGTIELEDEPIQVMAGLIEGGLGTPQRLTTGDVDGDGAADLIIGWSGSRVGETWVLAGPLSTVVSRAEAAVIVVDVDPIGVVAPGDLDGDGHGDLIMVSTHTATPGVGDDLHAQIVYAPRGVVEADASLVSTQPDGDCAVGALAALGDLDLDGRADFAVGSAGCSVDGIDNSGAAFVILGAATGF